MGSYRAPLNEKINLPFRRSVVVPVAVVAVIFLGFTLVKAKLPPNETSS